MLKPLVSLIDHALLHPTLTEAQLREGCALACRMGVASVCVQPHFVALAAELVAGSNSFVSTVIDFPHGANLPEVKALATRLACDAGACEVDMVANLSRVLSGDWAYVERDIRAVVDAAHAFGAKTKVIFETDYLPDDACKIQLCQVAERAGAEFVKTSTGFGYVKQDDGRMASRGATEHDVALMRAHVSERVQVKASGGIRSYADARRLVELGATRLGTSASAAIAAGEADAAGTLQADVDY